MIVGSEQEPDYYWLVETQKMGLCRYDILIRHPEYHLTPSAYLLKRGVVGIGVEGKFYLIDYEGITLEVDMPCRFYDIIYCDEIKIIIHDEIGFVCIDYDGNKRWEKVPGLLNSFNLQQNEIIYKTIEGEPGSISF